MHRLTPNWTWTLNSQKYLMYTEHLPLRPRFWSISLYDQPFPRYKLYKVGKNRKCNDWPQINLQHLTVKSTLYTLKTYPRGPNFHPFCSTTSRFWDTRLSKIRNAPSGAKLTDLEHLTVKSTLYTLNIYPWDTNFGPYHSTTSGFQGIAHFIIPYRLPC